MKTERITTDIARAAELLRRGELVAVPTETVYGLAANGLDGKAVERVYAVKGRPEQKPLSLLVPDAAALDAYGEAPPGAYTLAEKFWPGPLTLVLRSKRKEPEIVRAGGDTVALRCPDHPLTLALLREAGIPLAAPSANPSGMPSPRTAGEVLDFFDGKIAAVVDGGESGIGRESTILDMSAAPYRILRQGALPEREISGALAAGLTVVGITGGSGCGKTTALRTLADMGALILDADAVYHELTVSDDALREELTARFGPVYEGKALNRKKLAAVVFNDPEALLDLNAITHKYVQREMDRRLENHAMAGGTLAAIDAIALLEAGVDRRCAFTVAVTAPLEDRVRRLTARDRIPEDAARTRIAAQKSDEYFETHCDYTLRNDGDRESFEKACIEFFTEVLKNVRGKEGREEGRPEASQCAVL